MQATITIKVEVLDDLVLKDIVLTLETVLPYIADNVVITSEEVTE